MSVRPERQREDQFERERMLLRMRPGIARAIARRFPTAGSAAVEEAVDEALAQIVRAGSHLGKPEQVKATWLVWARCRIIDERRSAEFRNRDLVGDLDHALRVQSKDVTQLTDDDRQWWRIREVLSVLKGDQRAWAEAWYDEVLSDTLPAGAQPRGLPTKLGWSPAKTKSVSQRARRKMAAFVKDRVSGTVCAERRALLDEFISTTARNSRCTAGGLDRERYEAVLFHVAGCEDCWALWRARKRSLLGRCQSVLLLPVDALSAAAHTLGERLAGAAVGAHSASQAILARVGLGGAGAAAVGSTTAIGTKTAAVCASVVCAAAATAGGEIAGVLPPLRERPVPTRDSSARKPAKVVAAPQRAARAAAGLQRVAPTRPSPVRSAATLAASSRSDPAKRTSTIQAPVTPGDLPPASAPRDPSTSTASNPTRFRRASTPSTPLEPLPGSSSTPPPSAKAAGRSGGCVPGSLGC